MFWVGTGVGDRRGPVCPRQQGIKDSCLAPDKLKFRLSSKNKFWFQNVWVCEARVGFGFKRCCPVWFAEQLSFIYLAFSSRQWRTRNSKVAPWLFELNNPLSRFPLQAWSCACHGSSSPAAPTAPRRSSWKLTCACLSCNMLSLRLF